RHLADRQGAEGGTAAWLPRGRPVGILSWPARVSLLEAHGGVAPAEPALPGNGRMGPRRGGGLPSSEGAAPATPPETRRQRQSLRLYVGHLAAGPRPFPGGAEVPGRASGSAGVADPWPD